MLVDIKIIPLVLIVYFCEGFNNDIPLREIEKPFRMAKLNLLWIKAKHRLTDPKLQSIFSELKIHDKEEMNYKHSKMNGKDKSGEDEAKLRKKLIGIMSTYGLLEHFGETDDPKLLERHKALNDGTNYVVKNVFQDQRLNQLWAKAEMAGFTHEELETLKEEFIHHQNKVDEYMSLLGEVGAKDPDEDENSIIYKPESWNELEVKEDKQGEQKPAEKMDRLEKAALLREKHMELRSGYENLDRLTADGPKSRDFVEPKVQGLWKMALDSNFTSNELTSLKEELLHYETRLLKLRHLQTEKVLEAARQVNRENVMDDNVIEYNIKKQARSVAKLHENIHSRIKERHSEL